MHNGKKSKKKHSKHARLHTLAQDMKAISATFEYRRRIVRKDANFVRLTHYQPQSKDEVSYVPTFSSVPAFLLIVYMYFRWAT